MLIPPSGLRRICPQKTKNTTIYEYLAALNSGMINLRRALLITAAQGLAILGQGNVEIALAGKSQPAPRS